MSVDTRAPSRLEAAAEKLHVATTAFNTRLATLERAILDTRIEIEAGVPLIPAGVKLKPGEAPPGVLHYARHRQSGQWTLIVSVNPQQYWPLLDAPRHLRVAAIDAFPTLVRQLEQAAISLAEQLTAREPKIAELVTLVESMVWPEPEPVVMPDPPKPDPIPRPKAPPGFAGFPGVIFDEAGMPPDADVADFINDMLNNAGRGRRR
jgi:hypothetical protein